MAQGPFVPAAQTGSSPFSAQSFLDALGGGFGSSFGGPIGGAIGGALAGGIGSALGLGGGKGGLSAHDALIHQQHQVTRAFNRQKEFQGTSHQRTVRDMHLAGLNPILSATKGATPGTNVNAGSLGTSDKAQRETAGVNQQLANNQSAKLSAETRLLNKQADLVGKQSDHEPDKQKLTNTENKLKIAQQGLTTVQSGLARQQIAKTIADTAKTDEETKNLTQQFKLLIQNTNLTEAQVNKARAELAPLLVDAAISKSAAGELIRKIKMMGFTGEIATLVKAGILASDLVDVETDPRETSSSAKDFLNTKNPKMTRSKGSRGKR